MFADIALNDILQ